MAHPSSADADEHGRGLDQYRRLGGNCIHLHEEGGETHGRRAIGEWLRRRQVRDEFFLCSQICHSGWDENAKRPIDRFTDAAVREDVAEDLELLKTRYIDLVYLDDNPGAPFEDVIEAVGGEIASGRVRAFGVRSWSVERLTAASAYARSIAAPGIAAIVTTELALASRIRPLWPEYVPFDSGLDGFVRATDVAVFAHAGDLNLGQCLFGDQDALAGMRPEWINRWDHPNNPALVRRVQDFAAVHGLTTREVNLAWVLNRPFPVVGILSLRGSLAAAPYERASQLVFDQGDLSVLK